MNANEKNIGQEIKGAMPDILIGFLQDIISENGMTGTISLVPSKLGFGLVQDIICQTVNGVTTRRVFGFTPVSARLEVLRNAEHWEMVLAG